jgi:hypothetical protein
MPTNDLVPNDRLKVTMVSVSINDDGTVLRHEATDYVAPEDVDAYVADARTRWQSVRISDQVDNGPAGDNGEYTPIESAE